MANIVYKKFIFIILLCLTTTILSMNSYSAHPTGKTKLHLLVENGELTFVKMGTLIGSSDFNINAEDNNGETALHSAVTYNRKKSISLLLIMHADPNKKNKWGFTPLAKALEECAISSSITLIENGADITTIYNPHNKGNLLFSFSGQSPSNEKISEDYTFFTPIHSALLYERLLPMNNYENLIQLTELYNPITGTINFDPNTEEETIKKILKFLKLHRININAQSKQGETLLHLAVSYDHKDIIALLLKMKADPNIKNKQGFTPLAKALQKRSIGCSRIFIENGVDPTAIYHPITGHNLLFKYNGQSPDNEVVTKDYFNFMVPLHSDLLHRGLNLIYWQQLKDETQTTKNLEFKENK